MTNWLQFTQKNNRWHHICWQFEKLFNYFVFMLLGYCNMIFIQTKSMPSSFIKFLIINLYYIKKKYCEAFNFPSKMLSLFLFYISFKIGKAFHHGFRCWQHSFLLGIFHSPLSLDKWVVEYFILVKCLKKIIELESIRQIVLSHCDPQLSHNARYASWCIDKSFHNNFPIIIARSFRCNVYIKVGSILYQNLPFVLMSVCKSFGKRRGIQSGNQNLYESSHSNF